MRADARERRERILGQARMLLAQLGGAVSLEQIAASSEVGIATLYRNFRSREELVHAVVLDTIADVKAAAEKATDSLRIGTPASFVWREFIYRLVDLQLGALAQALGPDSEAFGKHVADEQASALQSVETLLSALRTAEAIHSQFSASNLVIAIGIITRPPITTLPDESQAVTRQLVEAYIQWSCTGQRF